MPDSSKGKLFLGPTVYRVNGKVESARGVCYKKFQPI